MEEFLVSEVARAEGARGVVAWDKVVTFECDKARARRILRQAGRLSLKLESLSVRAMMHVLEGAGYTPSQWVVAAMGGVLEEEAGGHVQSYSWRILAGKEDVEATVTKGVVEEGEMFSIIASKECWHDIIVAVALAKGATSAQATSNAVDIRCRNELVKPILTAAAEAISSFDALRLEATARALEEHGFLEAASRFKADAADVRRRDPRLYRDYVDAEKWWAPKRARPE
jgi:hypothetical protein